MPQEPGLPEQDGCESPAVEEANTDNFFESLSDPQCGHWVPSQWLERTSTSLSFSHFSQ